MATFTFNSKGLNVNLTSRERRVLGRPSLVIDKERLLSADSVTFPGKLELGVRVSKRLLLGGALGEFRTSSKRTLVLGNLKAEGECLRIRLSHPSIDEIWVCGRAAKELEVQLAKFMK